MVDHVKFGALLPILVSWVRQGPELLTLVIFPISGQFVGDEDPEQPIAIVIKIEIANIVYVFVFTLNAPFTLVKIRC
jgi:hypothetical protein